MKTLNRLGLMLLVLGSATYKAQGKLHHFVYDDMFDDNLLDFNVFDDMQEQIKQLTQQMSSFGPSKENREAVKAAREALLKIKPEVTENEQNVIIKFNLDNVEKKSVELEVKEYAKPARAGLLKAYNILQGVIPVSQHGKIQFDITPNTLSVIRHVEIKKENKEDNKSSVSVYGSSFSEVVSLPTPVEITKEGVKAQTKDNVLTITLNKKKQAQESKKQQNKVAIAHA